MQFRQHCTNTLLWQSISLKKVQVVLCIWCFGFCRWRLWHCVWRVCALCCRFHLMFKSLSNRMYRRTSNMVGLSYPPSVIAVLKVKHTLSFILRNRRCFISQLLSLCFALQVSHTQLKKIKINGCFFNSGYFCPCGLQKKNF